MKTKWCNCNKKHRDGFSSTKWRRVDVNEYGYCDECGYVALDAPPPMGEETVKGSKIKHCKLPLDTTVMDYIIAMGNGIDDVHKKSGFYTRSKQYKESIR